MAHRVVKPFPYSEDGFTLIDLKVGDERSFGSMADGLVAEGWIESVAHEPVVAAEPSVDPETQANSAPRRGRPRK